jgi:hypothetical protein
MLLSVCYVLHAHGHDTVALSVVHEQISGEVLDEEHGVVREGLSVEGVQHGMARAIRCGGATVRLAARTVLERLATECALINLAILSTREGKTVRLELEHSLGRLKTHNEHKRENTRRGQRCTTPLHGAK